MQVNRKLTCYIAAARQKNKKNVPLWQFVCRKISAQLLENSCVLCCIQYAQRRCEKSK